MSGFKTAIPFAICILFVGGCQTPPPAAMHPGTTPSPATRDAQPVILISPTGALELDGKPIEKEVLSQKLSEKIRPPNNATTRDAPIPTIQFTDPGQNTYAQIHLVLKACWDANMRAVRIADRIVSLQQGNRI
jgi:hypothetical protein